MKPAPIPDDIFQKIGYQVDLAWMIMSTKNSGSDVHTDPDMTGAWNYLLSGEKHWVVFPQGKAEVKGPKLSWWRKQREL